MKNVRFILAVCTLVAGLPLLHGHSAEPDNLSELMQRKLQASQKVLEGIALNDFEKISKSAEDLLLIQDLAEHLASKSVEYGVRSREVVETLDEVRLLLEREVDLRREQATLAEVGRVWSGRVHHRGRPLLWSRSRRRAVHAAVRKSPGGPPRDCSRRALGITSGSAGSFNHASTARP